MNEIFQYTTKYNKSIKPQDGSNTNRVITNKHVKQQNKKEKTKTKQKQNKNTGEGVKQIIRF